MRGGPEIDALSCRSRKTIARLESDVLIAQGLSRASVAPGDDALADFTQGLAIAPPAEMLPGAAKGNERVGEVIFQAVGAVGDLLNIFENFSFVGGALHTGTIALARAASHRASVPKKGRAERAKVL